MSFWKNTEWRYIIEEYFLGYNPYWWGGYAVDNNLSGNNKGLYRTMCRIAKNKKRKIKYLNIKGAKND